MDMRKVTAGFSVLYLLGSAIEFYKYKVGSSILVFKDYPVAIAAVFFIGFSYLITSFAFNQPRAFIWLAISTGLLSIISSVILSLYSTYVSFGNSFEALPYALPSLLISTALFSWYIWGAVRYAKAS